MPLVDQLSATQPAARGQVLSGPSSGKGGRREPPRPRGDSPERGDQPRHLLHSTGATRTSDTSIGARPGGWHVFQLRNAASNRVGGTSTPKMKPARRLLRPLRSDPTTHFHMVVGPLPAAEADAAFELWKKAAGLVDIDAADIRIDNPVVGDGPLRRYWVRGTRLRRRSSVPGVIRWAERPVSTAPSGRTETAAACVRGSGWSRCCVADALRIGSGEGRRTVRGSVVYEEIDATLAEMAVLGSGSHKVADLEQHLVEIRRHPSLTRVQATDSRKRLSRAGKRHID